MILAYCGEVQFRSQQTMFDLLLIQLEMENFGLLLLYFSFHCTTFAFTLKCVCVLLFCLVHVIGVSAGPCAWHALQSQRTTSRAPLSPSSRL